MKTTHTHHIVPKHMGGTDDKSNLIELTPKQHAQAHKKLYEKYGKWEDKVAFEMLSGQITSYQAQQKARRLANLGKVHSEKHRLKNSLAKKKFFKNKENRENMKNKMKGNSNHLGKLHTEKTKEKISETLKGNTNKKGKTGYKLSKETRKKMSLSRMGNKNPATRPDVREKLRQAALRRYRKNK